MQRLRIRRTGRGRPRTRPDRLLADKAYSNQTIRSYLRRRRIKATIPQKSDQQKARLAKGSVGGRPPAFDPEAYKYYIRRSSYPLIGWLVDHVWATTSPTITWWAGRRIFVC